MPSANPSTGEGEGGNARKRLSRIYDDVLDDNRVILGDSLAFLGETFKVKRNRFASCVECLFFRVALCEGRGAQGRKRSTTSSGSWVRTTVYCFISALAQSDTTRGDAASRLRTPRP